MTMENVFQPTITKGNKIVAVVFDLFDEINLLILLRYNKSIKNYKYTSNVNFKKCIIFK